MQTSCGRSGRWSLEWPRAAAAVGLAPRADPSRPANSPCSLMEVESLCSWDRSRLNSPTTPTRSSVSSAPRSASKRRSRARPTRSSVRNMASPSARPSRRASYGAAHSARAYSGRWHSTRLAITTWMTVAGVSRIRTSGSGMCLSSSRASPIRPAMPLISGRAPRRRPARVKGSCGGRASIAISLTVAVISMTVCLLSLMVRSRSADTAKEGDPCPRTCPRTWPHWGTVTGNSSASSRRSAFSPPAACCSAVRCAAPRRARATPMQPSGTGKTYISLYLALKEVLNPNSPFRQVYMVRSSVPSRDMGFMPGKLQEKMQVYETPYVKMINDLFGRGDAFEIVNTKNIFKMVSTSFLRGTTFENCIVIADEVQNCSFQELDTLITRVGNNTKIIIGGDLEQCDLYRSKYDVTGLPHFIDILHQMECFWCYCRHE